MYTILLNESNELIVSVRERIMQGSKLVDTLHFLIDPIYKGQDMSNFAVFMDYILPVSKQSCTELLPLSAELYKDRLEYKIPFDITLTAEEGDIKAWLTLVNSETDESGNTIKYIRRTSPANIKILSISAGRGKTDKTDLDAINEKMKEIEARLYTIDESNKILNVSKADDIVIDDTTIRLTSNGKYIGTAISLDEAHDKLIDASTDGNIKVVEF